ncbi:MAG: hypothetical protein H0Z40_02355 [Desulfotomaculum sp.]|nr:hypothetical protein [Desulfotomaculum sp.]
MMNSQRWNFFAMLKDAPSINEIMETYPGVENLKFNACHDCPAFNTFYFTLFREKISG